MYDEAIDVINGEEVETPPMSADMADETRRRNSMSDENFDDTPTKVGTVGLIFYGLEIGIFGFFHFRFHCNT